MFLRNNACIICSFLLRMGLFTVLIAVGQNHLAWAESELSTRGHLSLQLGTRVSAVWKGQALGVVLDRLAAAEGIAFWVDRRVDLQRLVEVQFNDLPLSEVLDMLTKDHSLGWSSLGVICYVGPRDAAHEIATLLELTRDSIQELPTSQRTIWLHESPASWPRLSEPKLLLSEWLGEQEIILLHPELIPHDRWPAKKLPSLPLGERVVLLLVGFDLTCQISPDGDKCIVVPIERPVMITRNYEAGQKTRAIAEQMSREAPDFQITQQGRGLSATGRWEDHEKLAAYLSGGKPATQRVNPTQPGTVRKLFSLRLKNQPLGKVISHIVHQVGLNVVWDGSLLKDTSDPRKLHVSCEVQEVDLTTLLHAILDPVGIDFHLEEGHLKLFAPNE